MATYRIIDTLAPGDSFNVVREIPASTDFVYPLSYAWLTAKEFYYLPDSEALIQKEITSTYSGLVGEIVNNLDGSAVLSFELQPVETELLTGFSSYWYDIQVKNTQNQIFTVEYGKIHTLASVTGGK
jgi:hypothetical protein